MTKFVKTVAVLAVVVSLGACAMGPAQQESVASGDATFSSAQTK